MNSCIAALEGEGWTVEKPEGYRNAQIRRITKNGGSKLAAIRTTRDQCIAFTRTDDDTGWVTLCDVAVVVVAAVDPEDSAFAKIHIFEAKELKARFDHAYNTRLAAGHKVSAGISLWLSLYDEEALEPVSLVGAGAGIDNTPIARVPLAASAQTTQRLDEVGAGEERLNIAEVKARLARMLGVNSSCIKITVEA